MLAKNNRLRDKKKISFIFKKGKRTNGSFFSLVYLPSGENNFKAVFLIAKKVSQKATRRNRIRRLLSESVRLIQKEKNLPKINLVVRVLFDPKDVKLDNIKKDFEKCFEKLS